MNSLDLEHIEQLHKACSALGQPVQIDMGVIVGLAVIGVQMALLVIAYLNTKR